MQISNIELLANILAKIDPNILDLRAIYIPENSAMIDIDNRTFSITIEEIE